MKHLQDYQEEKQTALFEKTGAFFAFNNDQFNEAIEPGKKYVRVGQGFFCEKGKHIELINGLDEIHKEAVQQDLKDNGKKGVIRRELFNHEAFYTWDIEDTIDALDGYGITREEVAEVFREIAATEEV